VFFNTSVTVPSVAARYFALNAFDSYTSYTSLFDEYKFEEIECWLEPTLLLSATVSDAQMVSAVDWDDANNPTSFGSVGGKQNSIISGTGTGHYQKFQPHMAVAVYSGAFTSFGNSPPEWIDCASPGVQHYGLKAATNGPDGVARGIYLTIRALVSFRGPAI